MKKEVAVIVGGIEGVVRGYNYSIYSKDKSEIEDIKDIKKIIEEEGLGHIFSVYDMLNSKILVADRKVVVEVIDKMGKNMIDRGQMSEEEVGSIKVFANEKKEMKKLAEYISEKAKKETEFEVVLYSRARGRSMKVNIEGKDGSYIGIYNGNCFKISHIEALNINNQLRISGETKKVFKIKPIYVLPGKRGIVFKLFIK